MTSRRPVSGRNAWDAKGASNPGSAFNDEDDFAPTAMESEIYNAKTSGKLGEAMPKIVARKEDKAIGCCGKFQRIIRGIWATKQTEETEGNPDLKVKTTLRELIIYCVFLVMLCIMTFGMASSNMFYYTNVLNNLFLSTPWDNTNPQTNFADMSLPGDFFDYSENTLVKGLYQNWEHWYNNASVDPSVYGYIYYENKLLGVPRLRQVRVRNDTCVVPKDFKDQIKACYAAFSSSAEDTKAYRIANGTAWTYHSESELQGTSYWGKLGTYSGSGFYQDLLPNSVDSIAIIEDLKQNLWIDRGTRAVFVDFTVYNANINLFCVIKLVAEMPPTGGIVPSYTMRTVKLIRYAAPMDFFVLGCEALFCVFILYYLVEEFLEIKKLKLTYLKEFWNILDLLVLAISICCIIFNVYRTMVVNSMLEGILSNPNVFINFEFLSWAQDIFNSAMAIMVFAAWIKIFKYLSFNKTMTQLSSTLGACAKDLGGFAIMFFIIFLAFAQLGYLIFGTQVADFSSFQTSIFTLFRIILGDFNFQALQQANRVLGPAYFILYVFFVFFVLLNMFLAIINDTYSEVKSDMMNQPNEIDVGAFFKQRANTVMSKLHLKKNKIIEIQKAMTSADANGDKTIDFDEWRHDLKMRGYAEAEIEAVFAKYDANGDRLLDENELKKMQADLEGQKIAITQNMDEVNKGGMVLQDDEGGMGIRSEEFELLQRRVDRLENSIGSIVSKIDSVLVKLEAMERAKAKRRETIGKMIDNIAQSEGTSDEVKRVEMEKLIRSELEKWDSEPFAGPASRATTPRPR